MKNNKFDIIVIGVGAIGSAAIYQLAKRGKRVLGIDQFSPPHAHGSSHGDTRIIRQAVGEGEEYIPFVMRSYQLWREIEQESGADLHSLTGGLIISSPGSQAKTHVENFFENTIQSAKKYDIEHEVLSAQDIRQRFPQFNVQDSEVGYYEHHMGYVNPERAVQTQIALALKHGANIQTYEKVLNFSEHGSVVTVKTTKNEYTADKLIISAGAWLPTLLGSGYSDTLLVFRQIFFWFDIEDNFLNFLPYKFPTFIWDIQDKTQGVYGFPAIDGRQGGLKIATVQYEASVAAENVNRKVSQDEIDFMYENYVSPYIKNMGRKCNRSATCLYTSTSDRKFIIDKHPEFNRVILASPCSGHGFKYSAGVGESLAELAIDGHSKMDLSHFKMNRFLTTEIA